MDLNAVVPRVIPAFYLVVTKSVERNDALWSPGTSLSGFEGPEVPAIPLWDYLQRILNLYPDCHPYCYIAAYIYLVRYLRHTDLSINSLNAHRLLLTSIVVGFKFVENRRYHNAYFAQAGLISTTEMNFLELKFLFGLRFKLNVTPDVFDYYCSILASVMELEFPTMPTQVSSLSSEEETSNYSIKESNKLSDEDEDKETDIDSFKQLNIN